MKEDTFGKIFAIICVALTFEVYGMPQKVVKFKEGKCAKLQMYKLLKSRYSVKTML